jgi:phospholipase/carboxylesterase
MTSLVHHIVPARAERRGTLVFLHGLGDSPAGWSFLPHALELPWLEIVLVQAPISYGPGWAWYELDPSLRPTSNTRTDIAKSRTLLESLLLELDRPTESVVVGGFSQGSVMALETGLRSELPLAGLLCISGYVPLLADFPAGFGSHALERRILCTHGTWDQVIPHAFSEGQAVALAAMGVRIEMETFDKPHGLDEEEELPRIRSWLEETFAKA